MKDRSPAVQSQAQAAASVLMLRPACFGWNPETQASNRFQQQPGDAVADVQARAVDEFDGLVARLREAGVLVHVADDAPEQRCPDAVFPNNWVSLHADGTVVLYPMLAPNRRRERRLEIVTRLREEGGHSVVRLLDLTHHEGHGRFLEGTGSVVFDHIRRVAYAVLSPRTHHAPLHELCDELGYAPCVFEASDASGDAIYHTNVMLAVGTRFAVVVAEAIVPANRDDVVRRLHASGRDVITIDLAAMHRYAGNVLELRAVDGAGVLAMSGTAAHAFGPVAIERLRSSVDRLVVAPIPTIETLGGGSVRCMLAEVFLPR